MLQETTRETPVRTHRFDKMRSKIMVEEEGYLSIADLDGGRNLGKIMTIVKPNSLDGLDIHLSGGTKISILYEETVVDWARIGSILFQNHLTTKPVPIVSKSDAKYGKNRSNFASNLNAVLKIFEKQEKDSASIRLQRMNLLDDDTAVQDTEDRAVQGTEVAIHVERENPFNDLKRKHLFPDNDDSSLNFLDDAEEIPWKRRKCSLPTFELGEENVAGPFIISLNKLFSDVKIRKTRFRTFSNVRTRSTVHIDQMHEFDKSVKKVSQSSGFGLQTYSMHVFVPNPEYEGKSDDSSSSEEDEKDLTNQIDLEGTRLWIQKFNRQTDLIHQQEMVQEMVDLNHISINGGQHSLQKLFEDFQNATNPSPVIVSTTILAGTVVKRSEVNKYANFHNAKQSIYKKIGVRERLNSIAYALNLTLSKKENLDYFIKNLTEDPAFYGLDFSIKSGKTRRIFSMFFGNKWMTLTLKKFIHNTNLYFKKTEQGYYLTKVASPMSWEDIEDFAGIYKKSDLPDGKLEDIFNSMIKEIVTEAKKQNDAELLRMNTWKAGSYSSNWTFNPGNDLFSRVKKAITEHQKVDLFRSLKDQLEEETEIQFTKKTKQKAMDVIKQHKVQLRYKSNHLNVLEKLSHDKKAKGSPVQSSRSISNLKTHIKEILIEDKNLTNSDPLKLKIGKANFVFLTTALGNINITLAWTKDQLEQVKPTENEEATMNTMNTMKPIFFVLLQEPNQDISLLIHDPLFKDYTVHIFQTCNGYAQMDQAEDQGILHDAGLDKAFNWYRMNEGRTKNLIAPSQDLPSTFFNTSSIESYILEQDHLKSSCPDIPQLLVFLLDRPFNHKVLIEGMKEVNGVVIYAPFDVTHNMKRLFESFNEVQVSMSPEERTHYNDLKDLMKDMETEAEIQEQLRLELEISTSSEALKLKVKKFAQKSIEKLKSKKSEL